MATIADVIASFKVGFDAAEEIDNPTVVADKLLEELDEHKAILIELSKLMHGRYVIHQAETEARAGDINLLNGESIFTYITRDWYNTSTRPEGAVITVRSPETGEDIREFLTEEDMLHWMREQLIAMDYYPAF